MRAAFSLCFIACILLAWVPSATAQEPSLADDWKSLTRSKWQNEKPTEAWNLLDAKWKKVFEKVGIKGWSRVEVRFAAEGDDPDEDYRMAWAFYAEGKKDAVERAGGVPVKLAKEKGDRFLLIGKNGKKVKYTIEDGNVILDGIFPGSPATSPVILTGTYKGQEPKK